MTGGIQPGNEASNASLIDLAVVSNLPQLHKCSIVPPLANSDHSALDLSVKWRNIRRPATSSRRVVWKYAQADFGKPVRSLKELTGMP